MMWEAGEGSTESSSVAAGVRGSGSSIGIGVTGGRRKPSWRERENNRRRERRRRAIASQIYAGLRAQGNFNLPKHCDNNEVLKALCAEAGWVVESDGTTYRKGSKPVPMEIGGTSANVTPCSSRNPSPPSSCFASPIPSYVPSPLSSACPSPTRFERSMPSNYPYAPFHINAIPPLPPLRISNSAPVSPPPRSPSRHHPLKQDFNLKTHVAKEPETPMFSLNYPFKGVSAAPMSPIRGQRVAPPPPAPIPECDESDTSTNESLQWMNLKLMENDVSPTFNLVKPVAQWMPFGGGGNADADADADVSDKGKSEEFGFENAGVNAWKGERVQNVGMEDDLELTLGSKNARV